MQLGNLTAQVCRKDSVSCRIPDNGGQHHNCCTHLTEEDTEVTGEHCSARELTELDWYPGGLALLPASPAAFPSMV